MSTSYEIDGDIRGPRGAERALRQSATYLGDGVAGSCITVRGKLATLGVEGESPLLLARITDALIGLRATGNRHADEFARQVGRMRDEIAGNKALRNTQNGGWLDPRNDL